MSSRILAIIFAVLAVALVAVASIKPSETAAANSPERAVQSLYQDVKAHNFTAAYSYVDKSSNVDPQTFMRELNGKDGSLRTFSSLQDVSTKALKESSDEALVRANVEWSTAVGAFHESRDLKVVRAGEGWKVVWPAQKQENVPPQVIPVTFLRWDIIKRGTDDEWGAQNVEAPKVRITSMNAVQQNDSTIVVGEIVNEDTVPAFVAVGATLINKDGKTIGDETSFDKISHVLLPKEVSPFRIDFPKTKLADVKNVRMTPNALLVAASADPVIGVLHQRIEKNERGKPTLQGELVNESGITVNIPHVIATYYDDAGRVIWVADGYVDRALPPQTPTPFSVELREDLASKVHSYRVTVNNYTIDRQTL